MNSSKKEILKSGKYLNLCKTEHWEWVERKQVSGVVMIIPINSKREVIFVEQYRIPLGKNVIELPAGLVGDNKKYRGEKLEIAAKRELLEETGYAAPSLKLVASGPPSAGMSNEIIHIYLAKNIKKVGNGGGNPQENEAIVVHEVPVEKIQGFLKRKVKDGCLVDPKVYVGLFFIKTNKV